MGKSLTSRDKINSESVMWEDLNDINEGGINRPSRFQ